MTTNSVYPTNTLYTSSTEYWGSSRYPICIEYIWHIPSLSKYMPCIWGNVMTPQYFVGVLYKVYVGYIELVVICQAYAIYIPYIYWHITRIIHIILVVTYQPYAIYIACYYWYLNVPDMFHMYFITEHVTFHFCIEQDFDDIQTVLWLHTLITSE